MSSRPHHFPRACELSEKNAFCMFYLAPTRGATTFRERALVRNVVAPLVGARIIHRCLSRTDNKAQRTLRIAESQKRCPPLQRSGNEGRTTGEDVGTTTQQRLAS